MSSVKCNLICLPLQVTITGTMAHIDSDTHKQVWFDGMEHYFLMPNRLIYIIGC